MQDQPPQHRRFTDTKIPKHVTYAYKEGVKIVKNDDFYVFPEGESPKIDLLFLIANAPVPTASLPEGGLGSYVGLAVTMKLAMDELYNKFPLFFGEDTESRECET